MTDAPELARNIVDRLEAAETKSAAVTRNMVYRLLSAAGLDVDRLRRDACLQQIDTLEKRAKRAKDNRSFHEVRLEALKARLGTFSHEPTREMVQQKGEPPIVQAFDEAGHPLRCARHRWNWPVDNVAHCLPAEHYQAAERLRWAYTARDGASRISDYGTSSGRADPHDRLALTPEQEEAARVWNVLWLRCNPTLRFIAWNFILEQAPQGFDKPWTAFEFGKRYGMTTNDSRARGVADGALITCCAMLAEILRGHGAWRDRQDSRRRPPPVTASERRMIDNWNIK